LVALLISPGVVQLFAGPNIPTGWLICDGTAISRTTYAALFAAIGTTWGGGDNINTFNLPDLRGRAPIGYVDAAVGGITARALGALGGEETHTLAVSEMPNHGHTVNDSMHSHGVNDGGHYHSYVNPIGNVGAAAGSVQYSGSGTANTGTSTANITIQASRANISLQNTGGGAAANVMQPFAVIHFIIKT
jgi:microcystin-dependent protein